MKLNFAAAVRLIPDTSETSMPDTTTSDTCSRFAKPTTIIGGPGAMARDWKRMRDVLKVISDISRDGGGNRTADVLASLECKECSEQAGIVYSHKNSEGV